MRYRQQLTAKGHEPCFAVICAERQPRRQRSGGSQPNSELSCERRSQRWLACAVGVLGTRSLTLCIWGVFFCATVSSANLAWCFDAIVFQSHSHATRTAHLWPPPVSASSAPQERSVRRKSFEMPATKMQGFPQQAISPNLMTKPATAMFNKVTIKRPCKCSVRRPS
jgi:hypothetical protein